MKPTSNPWFDNPKPRSLQQPDLIITLHTFRSPSPISFDGTGYPYRLSKRSPNRIPFYEFVGRGPPPDDIVGNPSDIYIDTTGPIVVYFRGNVRWECWNPVTGGAYIVLLHPFLIGRYLWRPRTGERRLGWISDRALRNTGIFAGRPFDPSVRLAETYSRRIPRSRHDEGESVDDWDSNSHSEHEEAPLPSLNMMKIGPPRKRMKMTQSVENQEGSTSAQPVRVPCSSRAVTCAMQTTKHKSALVALRKERERTLALTEELRKAQIVIAELQQLNNNARDEPVLTTRNITEHTTRYKRVAVALKEERKKTLALTEELRKVREHERENLPDVNNVDNELALTRASLGTTSEGFEAAAGSASKAWEIVRELIAKTTANQTA
ncbi:hypothetical protein BD779DRAFT_602185 [Infundibulicybe gibba]|nr:hypothetical protein BD779DRAFT_602185 [Infundibulicybe gibba]